MNLFQEHARFLTRRHFLKRCNTGLGAAALASMLGPRAFGSDASPASGVTRGNPLAPKSAPLPARAKRIIYLHMSGGPPQHDLFDYKPKLKQLNGTPCPKEIFQGERFAFIKGTPKLLGSPYKFAQQGKSGAWVSELLPHFTSIVDDVALVKSMWTDQFNHAPAEMLLFTGNQRPGYASMGSWVTYGLGSENQDLPGFVVLISGGTDPTDRKSVVVGKECRSRWSPYH